MTRFVSVVKARTPMSAPVMRRAPASRRVVRIIRATFGSEPPQTSDGTSTFPPQLENTRSAEFACRSSSGTCRVRLKGPDQGAPALPRRRVSRALIDDKGGSDGGPSAPFCALLIAKHP